MLVLIVLTEQSILRQRCSHHSKKKLGQGLTANIHEGLMYKKSVISKRIHKLHLDSLIHGTQILTLCLHHSSWFFLESCVCRQIFLCFLSTS